MRLFVLLAAGSALAWAQSTVTTYTADPTNGGYATSSSTTSSDHTQTQTAVSLNGQRVPLEQHEEHILSSNASESVTESIVRRYDATGQLMSTERTVTDLRRLPGGGSTATATKYTSDVNGGSQPTERSTTETRVSGSTTTVDTVVDRPTLNGSFEAVEKRSAVSQSETHGKDKSSSTTETIYRGSSDSGFREAQRTVTRETVSGDQTVQDTTDYEPGSQNGALQFQERRVSTTSSTPDGSRSSIVDVYAPSADGTVRDPEAAPQIKQEQIITHIKKPDGSVVDTFSVREPSVSDPTKLGDAKQVTQTVCTGKCDTPPAGVPAAPVPAKQ